VDILLIWPTVGFRQPVCASGAYGSSTPSAVRYSHLGCRWKHCGTIARAGGSMPAPTTVDDRPAFDMHEHEPQASGYGSR
jgi:hypothetical protein